jgi:hypothetical protein
MQTPAVPAAATRQKTVSGWVPVGGPFGGSAATPWLTMLAGDDDALLQLVQVHSISYYGAASLECSAHFQRGLISSHAA